MYLRSLACVVGLFVLTAVGCEDRHSAADPDAASVDAPRGDAAGSDAAVALQGRTRIALIRDGMVYVTDATASRLVQAYPGEPLTSLYDVALSADAATVAFCASDDLAAIYPFAGPVGAVHKLAAGPMCKGAQPLSDGSAVWIRYGEGVDPAKQLRVTDLQGAPGQGDNQVGFRQMWTPRPLANDRYVVVLLGGGGLFGSIWRVDRQTGERQLVVDIDNDVGADYHVGADDRIAFTYLGDLHVVAAAGGDYAKHLDLAEYPDIDIRFVESPTWSADGSKVAFYGRSQPGGNRTEILVYDLEAQSVTQLTADETSDIYPRFGATGDWVYWIRGATDLVRKRADGSGSIEVVVAGGVQGRFDVAWLP